MTRDNFKKGMPRKTGELVWNHFHDCYDLWIINPEEVQKQTCEKLVSDFGLTKEEATSYYDMIKHEKNNEIINEIEKKIKVKVESTGNFKIEYTEL